MESGVEVSVSCAFFHSGHPDRAALRNEPFSSSPELVRMIPVRLCHSTLVHILSLVHLLFVNLYLSSVFYPSRVLDL